MNSGRGTQEPASIRRRRASPHVHGYDGARDARFVVPPAGSSQHNMGEEMKGRKVDPNIKIDVFSNWLIHKEAELLEVRLYFQSGKAIDQDYGELNGQIRQHQRIMSKWFAMVDPPPAPKPPGLFQKITAWWRARRRNTAPSTTLDRNVRLAYDTWHNSRA